MDEASASVLERLAHLSREPELARRLAEAPPEARDYLAQRTSLLATPAGAAAAMLALISGAGFVSAAVFVLIFPALALFPLMLGGASGLVALALFAIAPLMRRSRPLRAECVGRLAQIASLESSVSGSGRFGTRLQAVLLLADGARMTLPVAAGLARSLHAGRIGIAHGVEIAGSEVLVAFRDWGEGAPAA